MHIHRTSRRASGTRTLAAASALATLVFAACSSDATAPAPVRVATTFSIVSGDAQTTKVGVTPAKPLVVKVLDQKGVALMGVPIAWNLPGGFGTLVGATGLTDASGLAQVEVLPATVAGSMLVTAAVSGLSTLTFTMTLTASEATSLVLVSGDNQTAPVGTMLPTALVVRVSDVFGNAISGVTVSWTTEDGGTLVTGSATTDALGRASSTLQLGPMLGANRVLVAVQGIASITFNSMGN